MVKRERQRGMRNKDYKRHEETFWGEYVHGFYGSDIYIYINIGQNIKLYILSMCSLQYINYTSIK